MNAKTSQSNSKAVVYQCDLVNHLNALTADLNLINLECLLQENHTLQIHLEKSKETIKTFANEYNKVLSNPSIYK